LLIFNCNNCCVILYLLSFYSILSKIKI